MPTNKTISQVSINVDLEDRVEGKGEFELIELMPQMHLNVREAARYDGVTVETSNTNDSLWVYTGKRRYPSIWFFLWIFGPALLLSVLTPVPFYAYLSEYKHIRTLPTTICSTTGVDYNPSGLYLRVKATYLDNQKVRHSAEFLYNLGYDMNVDNYLLDFFDHRLSYPCYFSGAKFYETGYPGFVISYAKTTAWKVAIGLACCWLAILLITCLCFFAPWFLDHNKRVITKNVFEKTGEELVEIQDWGTVDAALKQIMYSVVYTSVVPENNTNQSGKKGVKFISFTRHSATTLLSTVIFSAFAFLFFAGMIVMFVIAFTEREHVFLVMLMWCLVSIVAIVPSSLVFLVLYTTHQHPYLNATAVVNPITPQPGDAPETVSIFGKYYPDRKLGYVLRGTVRRA